MTYATNDYLSAQVLTAPPQKLHLMLIDGAIRFATQAKRVWNDEARRSAREEALTRCVKISGEMLASMRTSRLPARQQFISVYAWLFRTLTEAKLLSDQSKLDEALELLAIERETWRRVCERCETEDPPHDDKVPAAATTLTPLSQDVPLTGLSLEA